MRQRVCLSLDRKTIQAVDLLTVELGSNRSQTIEKIVDVALKSLLEKIEERN